MQTCRRHPEAGRFMRTCPGCARNLHDLQQANRVETAATQALATIGMTVSTDLTILSAHLTDTTLTVATRHEGAYFEYGVDVLRLPTAEETDPELADDYRLNPGEWVLIWQAGDHHPDTVPSMLADARRHLTRSGLTQDDTPTTLYPAPTSTPAPVLTEVIVLHDLPTRPVLPATQTDAHQAASAAVAAMWDHVEDCTLCLAAEDTTQPDRTHCRTGAFLARRVTDTATVAHDWARLHHWYRQGGMEQHNANDWIAN